jgi:hypothetical protein
LRHLACSGQCRAALLHRLEQLAFPPSAATVQTAVAPAALAGLLDPPVAGPLAAGRFAAERERRRFRSVWDAVAWLKVHRHEIDLDGPYVPRK